jgi:uncharacterized membrane protein
MSNRFERVLAYMVAGTIILSLVSFIAILVATATGLARADFAVGMWPLVTVMPLIGLPIGFALIVTLLIVSARRRGRAARDVRN